MQETLPADERSLYRKYRSRTFSDLIGQEHVTQTLRNAVRTGSVGHAYLFTGMRGTGKTSAARILARAVNCLDPHDGEPCNACAPCVAMLQHRCLDLIEIDAASHRDVQFARELREKIGYAPSELKRKVYIFDEVHMLTPEACNTLLKTLEEPPPNVIFLLATTDAHKMLPTIVSRCQRLELRPIAVRDITARLAYVCACEGITADPAALEMIAAHATGSLRDALSLLDQVRAYEGATIGVTEVEQSLGLARGDTLAQLTDHVVAGDSGAAMGLVATLATGGADMQQYAKQLVQYWRDLLLLCAGADALPGRTPDARMIEQAKRLSVGDVTAIFKVILQPDYSGRRGASAQWQLELAVVEACEHFAAVGQQRPARSGARVAAPAVETRAASTAAAPPALEVTPAAVEAPRAAPTVAAPEAEPVLDMPPEPVDRPRVPGPDANGREAPPAAVAPMAQEAATAPAPPVAADDVAVAVELAPPARAGGPRTPQQVWDDVMRRLSATPEKKRIAAFFNGSCTPLSLNDDTFVLGFFAEYSLIKDRADKPANRAVVLQALQDVIGKAISLRYDTIKEAPTAGGRSSAASSDDFIARAARDLRAIHVERDAR